MIFHFTTAIGAVAAAGRKLRNGEMEAKMCKTQELPVARFWLGVEAAHIIPPCRITFASPPQRGFGFVRKRDADTAQHLSGPLPLPLLHTIRLIKYFH